MPADFEKLRNTASAQPKQADRGIAFINGLAELLREKDANPSTLADELNANAHALAQVLSQPDRRTDMPGTSTEMIPPGGGGVDKATAAGTSPSTQTTGTVPSSNTPQPDTNQPVPATQPGGNPSATEPDGSTLPPTPSEQNPEGVNTSP